LTGHPGLLYPSFPRCVLGGLPCYRPFRAATCECPRKVAPVGWVQLQVVRPIVSVIIVQVMWDLFREESSPDLLFHHQPMFSDVPMAVRVRVIWTLQENIPILVNMAATLPVTIALQRCPCSSNRSTCLPNRFGYPAVVRLESLRNLIKGRPSFVQGESFDSSFCVPRPRPNRSSRHPNRLGDPPCVRVKLCRHESQ